MAVTHWAQAWHTLSVHKMLKIRLSKKEWTGRFGPPNLSPTPEKSILGTNVAFFTKVHWPWVYLSLIQNMELQGTRGAIYLTNSMSPTTVTLQWGSLTLCLQASPRAGQSGILWDLGFGCFWLISQPLWVSDVPFIKESFTQNRCDN